jgi:glycerol-3-phosphate acyltransferase PlsX
MTRIVLDAMGSDNHPQPELEAAAEAVRRWDEPILLTGPRETLQGALRQMGVSLDKLEIVDAPEVLQMTDKPARSARGKPRSSMAVGMELLKEGRAQAFVTAGNTGGAMANALFRLGRLRGLKRPALAIAVPVHGGHAVVLDIGANADCKPDYLLQFALLGAVYAQIVLGVKQPRVGLLSNGEEPGKGNQLVKEAYPLLARAGLNFSGNVEPKEFYGGAVDVAVTDGFTGNVLIKTSEAVAKMLIEIIRREIKASPLSSAGGLLARGAFRRVAKLLDPSEYGAAPLLGVRGLVFIGHGRSDAKALINAIRVAREAVQGDLLGALQEALQGQLAVAVNEGAPT